MVGLVSAKLGTSVTVGAAAALGTGSLMRSAGVEWRLDSVLAAAVALLALATLPGGLQATVSSGSIMALPRRPGDRLSAVRPELVFVAALGVPMSSATARWSTKPTGCSPARAWPASACWPASPTSARS